MCDRSVNGDVPGMKQIGSGFMVVFVPGIILFAVVFALATNGTSSSSNPESTTAAEPTASAPATSTAAEPASNEPGEIVKAPAFTADELAAPAAADWITNGGSTANHALLDAGRDQRPEHRATSRASG